MLDQSLIFAKGLAKRFTRMHQQAGDLYLVMLIFP